MLAAGCYCAAAQMLTVGTPDGMHGRPQGQSASLPQTSAQIMPSAPGLIGKQPGVAPGKSAADPHSESSVHERVQVW